MIFNFAEHFATIVPTALTVLQVMKTRVCGYTKIRIKTVNPLKQESVQTAGGGSGIISQIMQGNGYI